MEEFIAVATSYPTIVFTFGLIFVLMFWALSLIGIVDVDFIDVGLDFDIDVDTDPGLFGSLGGFLLYFGLNGIPITVVLTVLILVAWTLAYFVSAYLIVPLPFDWLRYIAGTAVIAGAIALAMPITGMSLRPTRHIFTGESAKTNDSFVGSKGSVTTLEVTESFGQAEVADGGAGLLVNIRAEEPNTLKKGDEVALLSYDAANGTYRVMSEKEFMKL